MKILVALTVVFALVCVVLAEVDKSVCLLPKAVGGDDIECRAYIPSYFYNSETKECEFFVYGGCLGNGNRFETKEECEDLCLGA